ncbi:hypothetical protein D3C87_1917660 [compost metagenome]
MVVALHRGHGMNTCFPVPGLPGLIPIEQMLNQLGNAVAVFVRLPCSLFFA